MDYLNVRESLYLLARIRGVPFGQIRSVVEAISSLFLLDPFEKNYIHQLSGGTKRRLHAALALIGRLVLFISVHAYSCYSSRTSTGGDSR